MLQFSPLPQREGFEGNSLISACFVLVSQAAECLKVSLLFPPFQLSVSLHHFVTLSCWLVSDFLLLLPISVHPSFSLSSPCSFLSPTSSVSCFSLVSLFCFSPLVSELLSLIPPLHLPPFIVLLSVILAKSTFIGEEYPHGNAADGDF